MVSGQYYVRSDWGLPWGIGVQRQLQQRRYILGHQPEGRTEPTAILPGTVPLCVSLAFIPLGGSDVKY